MNERLQTIQSDFDEIALLSTEDFNHNAYYHDFLLKQVPTDCQNALEIGCGTGLFSRHLATVSQQVLAVDLSPQMIRVAKAGLTIPANIDFQIGEVMAMDFGEESFDCIASIATLHHLPMGEILIKMKNALRTGGRLLILDLFQAQGLSDLFANAVALPMSVAIRLMRTGRLRPDRKTRAIWEQHARQDRFLTLTQVRNLCAEVLPKAKIKQHLFWRYSIVWEKETH